MTPVFPLLLGIAASGAVVMDARATARDACTPMPGSNVGCEFYAVTLPNFVDQGQFPFGLSLLNTGSDAVDVTISGGALAQAIALNIAAGAASAQTLPWVTAITLETGTYKAADGAYHIVATGPLVVLQLNPADGGTAETPASSGDSSLLLPVASAGVAYRIVSWPTESYGIQYPGFVAVVATVDATTVQVAVGGGLQAGDGLGTTGGTVMLDRGDVMLMSSALDAPVGGTGSDLSGMSVTASAPVLTFAGHAWTTVPSNTANQDHLEEMLPPLNALSNEYLVTRPGNPTGADTGGRNVVKFVGLHDDTAITYTPPFPDAPSQIQEGQVATVEADFDFRVEASAPLLVAQFMEGGGTVGFGDKGDPGMTIAVPLRDLQTDAVFLAPAQLAPASAQVVAKTGASVTLDGTEVTVWNEITGTDYSVANVALAATDSHSVHSDRRFLLNVFAYPPFAGYWHPGVLGVADGMFADGFE